MNESSKRTNIISWLAAGLWMGVIFYLSHQPSSSSNELSTGVMSILKENVFALMPFDWDTGSLHHFIRKSAHFFAYFLLGILTFNAMIKSFPRIEKKNTLWAFMICVLYAVSDETHQLFISGRSGEVKDIILDSSGSLVGIMVFLLGYRLIKSKKTD